MPLRVRAKNLANYQDAFFENVYVPGQLQAGKRFQIVFACVGNSGCADHLEGVLTYPDPSQAAMGTFVPEPAFNGSNFTMGPAPGFSGVDYCADSLADNALQFPPNVAYPASQTACGFITIGSNVRHSQRPRRHYAALRTDRTPARPFVADAARAHRSHSGPSLCR